MKRTIYVAVILMGVTALWSGCSEQEGTPVSPPTEMEIGWVTMLPNLISQSDSYAQIRAAITGVDPLSVDSVKVFIYDSLYTPLPAFHLYDDANAFTLTDALEFCSDRSGDNVSNDGIYSRMVNSWFADSTEGMYHFLAIAWRDTETAETPYNSIMVASSQPPVLSGLNFPDSLESGFSPTQISLQVYDPDISDFDSIAAVYMLLYSPSDAFLDSFQLEPLDNANYGTILTPDLAHNRITGDYIFTFKAWDSFGAASDSLGKQVPMINLPPQLALPAYPDTVNLPVGGTITEVLITIGVSDDQTVLDVDEVYMFSIKPDGSPGNNGLPIPMVDNGLPLDTLRWNEGYLGDETAGDSVYSTTAILYETSQNGVYQFTFEAADLVGNISDVLLDSLVVIP